MGPWSRLTILTLIFAEALCSRAFAVPVTNILTQPNTELVQTQRHSVGSGTSSAVTMAAAQTAGNVNVVFIALFSTSPTVTSISDSAGNTYTLAAGPTTSTKFRMYAYYANKIKASSAGANTITVNTSGSTGFDVVVSEYTGIDASNPLDTTGSGTGSTSSVSIALTTTSPNDIIVASGATPDFFVACSSNETYVQGAYDGGNDLIWIAQGTRSSAGSTTVDCPLNSSNDWAMQVLAFRSTKPPPVPPIAYVQGKTSTGTGSATSKTITYSSAQTAGNLNVVVIGAASGKTISSVTDSRGNAYTLAIGPTSSSSFSQWIYYAPNIVSASAGANTVTVTLSSSSSSLVVRVAEYSGLSTTSPLDQTAGGVGTATCGTAYTSSVTTSSNRQLVVVGMTGAWTGTTLVPFVTQRLSGARQDLLGDFVTYKRAIYKVGAITANCSESVTQLATFK